MIFHIFIYIVHLLREYYELTMRPAPKWLDSSVGRALHRRGHGSESRVSVRAGHNHREKKETEKPLAPKVDYYLLW